MPETALEEQVRHLSRKFDALFLGVKIFLLLLLLTFSVGGILSTLSIDKYQQIFADALPGKPLPGLTLLVLFLKPYLFCLAFFWPVMGIFAATLRKNVVLSLSLLCVASAGLLIQSVIILCAMQLPLIGIITGMAGPP